MCFTFTAIGYGPSTRSIFVFRVCGMLPPERLPQLSAAAARCAAGAGAAASGMASVTASGSTGVFLEGLAGLVAIAQFVWAAVGVRSSKLTRRRRKSVQRFIFAALAHSTSRTLDCRSQPRLVAELHTSTNMTEPQQLILIAEVERLLRAAAAERRGAGLRAIFLLSHRSAADAAARAQPASRRRRPPCRDLAQRRAGVNPPRGADPPLPGADGARPAQHRFPARRPHPPLTGRDKTPATLAQFGAKLKERTEKVGKFNVQADENLDACASTRTRTRPAALNSHTAPKFLLAHRHTTPPPPASVTTSSLSCFVSGEVPRRPRPARRRRPGRAGGRRPAEAEVVASAAEELHGEERVARRQQRRAPGQPAPGTRSTCRGSPLSVSSCSRRPVSSATTRPIKRRWRRRTAG